ncbi:flavodoxin [Thermoanaerobacterium saccharolyticum]|uniref:flavodoxin n=1 Tax=Thermoanaerobacterium saccharolyticum TaxID=28896 RepID=UPI0005EDBDC2
MDKKVLVAYFSCTGITKSVAEILADVVGADIYEMKPEVPYTDADLNWMDKKSRSSVEMKDPSSRPAIVDKVSNIMGYEVVFVGFPIWWYTAPNIINTFLESYDFSGKTIILFATSGGSGFGKTVEKLKNSVSPEAKIKEGRILNGKPSRGELASWIKDLGL